MIQNLTQYHHDISQIIQTQLLLRFTIWVLFSGLPCKETSLQPFCMIFESTSWPLWAPGSNRLIPGTTGIFSISCLHQIFQILNLGLTAWHGKKTSTVVMASPVVAAVSLWFPRRNHHRVHPKTRLSWSLSRHWRAASQLSKKHGLVLVFCWFFVLSR